MKLSVCIFTFNHEQYIAQTIESVLRQITHFDFEIVIGEDCSTDGTAEIVRAYQERYPQKIRAVLNTINKGMMQNNADTILQCRGELIALLDGDDYWTYPFKLQRQAELLDKERSCTICFHDAAVLNINGQFEDNLTCCSNLKRTIYRFTDIISDVSIPTNSIMFRRSALAGYPPDWFFTLNAPDRPLYLLLSAVGSAYYFKACWSVYRKHPGGTWTGQHYQSRWLTHLKIFRTVDRHFDFRFTYSFRRSERLICCLLAYDLLKDNKIKRAVLFFKRALGLHHHKICINRMTLRFLIMLAGRTRWSPR